jgi:hypothetical protein
MKPTRHKFTLLKQVIEKIPGCLVSKSANEHGVKKKSRGILLWSHVVSLVYAQFSHALSLSDVCESLRNHSSALAARRGVSAPSPSWSASLASTASGGLAATSTARMPRRPSSSLSTRACMRPMCVERSSGATPIMLGHMARESVRSASSRGTDPIERPPTIRSRRCFGMPTIQDTAHE